MKMLGLYLRSLKSVAEIRWQLTETLGAISRNVFSYSLIKSPKREIHLDYLAYMLRPYGRFVAEK